MALAQPPLPPDDECRSCKGVSYNVFFPECEDDDTLRRARSVCVTCPVYDACRDYSIRHYELEADGIWAGWSSQQRRIMAGGYFYFPDWRHENWQSVRYRPRPLKRRPGRRHLMVVA